MCLSVCWVAGGVCMCVLGGERAVCVCVCSRYVECLWRPVFTDTAMEQVDSPPGGLPSSRWTPLHPAEELALLSGVSFITVGWLKLFSLFSLPCDIPLPLRLSPSAPSPHPLSGMHSQLLCSWPPLAGPV